MEASIQWVLANYGTKMQRWIHSSSKENNHYDGKALTMRSSETAYDNTNNAACYLLIQNTGVTTKVGIADDGMTAGLKVQLLNETRTSAFHC